MAKAKARSRSRSTSGKRRAPAKRRPAAPSRTQRIGQGSRQALSPHKGDIQGVTLILLGVLFALSVWAHDGGSAGHFIELLLRGLFGWGAYAVPLLVAGIGLALFRRAAGRAGEAVGGRVAIGLVAVLLGGLGLVHLAKGAPPRTAQALLLQHSGGLLGALITTRTSVAAVGRGLAGGARLVRSAVTPPAVGATPQVEAASATATTRPVGLDELPGEPEEAPSKRRGRRAVRTPEPPQPAEPEAEAKDDAEVPETPAPKRPAPAPADAPGAGEATQLAMTLKAEAGGAYTVPPPTLLRRGRSRPVDERRLDENQETLQRTLDQFGVDANVAGYTRGPTVTRYEVELDEGVKVARVIGLSHDIAYQLASPDVRIIAPIPGKKAIGIEVPNRDRELVTVGDIFDSPAMPSDKHPLRVALGKDIGGDPITANLAEMPHVLIAGATGAGKSVCLNVLVTSLLMHNSPDQVRLILIDPKRVELTHYEGVPHLITPVVTHPKRASEALNWAVREMELRLETLAQAGMRNLAAYNQAAVDGKLPPLPSASLEDDGRPDGERKRPPLPYIVLVIDELADLMMVAPREVEDAICRIAQMARAVGIHLVVATQRPSVDVVTGLIKANIPSRIAFMVASAQDSRVILDSGGADKLVGLGDMLYLPGGTSKPRRIQGAFITEKEVEAVVAYCKAQQQATYQPGVVAEGRHASDDDDGDEDPLLDQAMDIVVRSGLGSTSMLQSKMKVGFSRARRIMDQLEERGVVGPSDGSKPRDVLMTVEELDQLRGREADYGEIVGDE